VSVTRNQILVGDCRAVLATLPGSSVHAVVTSPPYWGLRDYGVAGQIGLETTPAEYVAVMVEVFGEVRRVLREDGTLWLVLGDSYTGSGKGGNPDPGSSKQATNAGSQTIGTFTNVSRRLCAEQGVASKNLVGIPWRVAFALQADGWYLRSDIIWSKPNPMPESVRDRPTKAHEYVFLLSKSAHYFYDAAAIAERATTGDMRNRRSVWTIATQPFPDAHFAVMPESLVEPCVLAGTSGGGACAECGAPRARVVERVRTLDGEPAVLPPMRTTSIAAPDSSQGVGHQRTTTRVTMAGWLPTCRHRDGATVPCVVLDPFAGAGTVSLVAHRLDRDWIGIEKNPEYVEIARRRLTETISQGRLFAGRAGP